MKDKVSFVVLSKDRDVYYVQDWGYSVSADVIRAFFDDEPPYRVVYSLEPTDGEFLVLHGFMGPMIQRVHYSPALQVCMLPRAWVGKRVSRYVEKL